jgi:hypothetical protein
MQWSEVVKAPSSRTLRQFAGLFLVVFVAMAATRWFRGHQDGWTIALGVTAIVVGLVGLAMPSAVRPLYTGWMIAAFPIGWVVSKVILAVVFFLVVTPIGLGFRMAGRDILRLRRQSQTTYWVPKTVRENSSDYLRQS